MAFLNKQGLEHLWDNIIYKLSKKVNKEDLDKTLESYATSEYVDNAIATAIDDAIGGSY